LITIRSTEEWKAWLERLAEYRRLTVADLIDQAIVSMARETRFPEPPPPR
jgi:hypothetical protein